ncbi:hypothetical protein A2V82_09880 [candidate division KSB1 bacterium RBG_16_48_16]|nr:MAG: hypothetical protein A2V82_09880 [candidate division KSB1 bacterium RBG_16_48_16]
MRVFFYLTFFILVVFFASRVLSLAVKGDLFKPGALKESFRDTGKNLWAGMKLFVIIWILYLIFIRLVRKGF